jgi:ElaB/YqjD/DUF883 family membrane-anchored ribosome-binding protein
MAEDVFLFMSDKASEYLEEAKARASEKLETGQRKLESAQRKLGKTARTATETADRYVRENPWRMVLIVALAACTFGYLLGASRD